jgi:hypothetical protein
MLRCEMRRDRRLETIGIDKVDRRANIRRGDKRRDILICTIVGIGAAPGRHRFHADGTQAGKCECAQQGAGDQRLAYTGIGAGDEKAVTGDG